ncbi:MAG TPA: tyrosine-type recombinase/integrase [Caldilineae bacterium]|nr:tyrosine-type recombinase/integrase [Caldilineae bacterium]
MTIDEAIEAYLDHLKAARSFGTARTYATGLRHLRRYLASCGVPPESTEVNALTLPIATGFVTWLYDYLLDEAGGDPQKISESTKGTYFAAVIGFFEYLIIEAQLLPMTMNEYDTLRKVFARAAKRQRRDILPPEKLPTREIIEALLREAYKPLDLPPDTPPSERRRQELIRLRNIAIIEALLSSGMRVGELVRLERGHLLHHVKGAVVKYAKGKKEREVLFSDRAWHAIQTYLRARQDTAQARPLASLPVFARHDRRAGSRILPLTTRSVQNIFFELASRSGILEMFHLTPHTLRHFFATEFLSETGDLALTQYALGHSSPTTTRIYAQTKREDYRRAHRHVFGSRGGIKIETMEPVEVDVSDEASGHGE